MVTINDLLKEYSNNERIPYLRLLETNEWQLKRAIIIKRDNETCTCCKNKTTEYLAERHIWWGDYIAGVKQPNAKFWEKLEYYEKLLGDKFIGISANEHDYEFVPEEMQYAVTLDKQYYLQVHHKLYIKGKFPWEYENDNLITLCNWCHFELHQKQQIPVYKELNSKLVKSKLTVCSRCNGAGFFPEYKHVIDGICFRCNGAKFEEFIDNN